MCFLVEVFHFQWEAIANYTDQIIFTTVWILIVFTVLYFIFKKIGIDPGAFLVYSIIFGHIMLYVGIFFSLAVESQKTNIIDRNYVKPSGFFELLFQSNLSVGLHKTNIIDRNYVGTSGMKEEDNENDNGTDTYYYNTFVFHKNDKSLTYEIIKLDEEYSEGSSKEEFIFWQTALAKGFEPKNIPGYNCCGNFSQKKELYLTVGPLTILECLIKAITPAFLLLIIPLIGFIFKKRLFFDDMESLRKFYNQFVPKDKYP